MNGPVVNLDKLSQLLGGNTTRAKQFLDLFLEQTPGRLLEMEQLGTSGQWESFSIEIHELKTQLAYLGIEEGAAWAQRIEDDCDQRPPEESFLKDWQAFKEYLARLWA